MQGRGQARIPVSLKTHGSRRAMEETMTWSTLLAAALTESICGEVPHTSIRTADLKAGNGPSAKPPSVNCDDSRSRRPSVQLARRRSDVHTRGLGCQSASAGAHAHPRRRPSPHSARTRSGNLRPFSAHRGRGGGDQAIVIGGRQAVYEADGHRGLGTRP